MDKRRTVTPRDSGLPWIDVDRKIILINQHFIALLPIQPRRHGTDTGGGGADE